jgi:hypothetical protein
MVRRGSKADRPPAGLKKSEANPIFNCRLRPKRGGYRRNGAPNGKPNGRMTFEIGSGVVGHEHAQNFGDINALEQSHEDGPNREFDVCHCDDSIRDKRLK